ncbi:penicillin acylase family protein [Roseomonas sp. BN140053]|uniref:penicillin acylase family protein n=1 Tax=Roseomonas sp. BN140053 TaxID=3391898 RepID=UPI0039E8FCCB
MTPAADPAGDTPATETIRLAGLQEPAEIALDRWGIPHLRAGSEADLWFLQGFNAARDRLWQLDLWRKRGLGLLAADLGPGFLAQDRASRLFLFRGDMDAEWATYAPDARSICERFVAGINAFVALCEAEPDRLPPEFTALGTEPARWAAEDVVRIRSHGLTRNALSEVVRANLLAAGGSPELDLLRKNTSPPRVPIVPDGLDLAAVPMAVLDGFKLGMAGVTLTPERLRATLAEAEAWTGVNELGEVIRDADWQGSNNWVVHGSRTETGRPILANDPHRAHAVPALRYLVHLSAPGFDAIGAGEPQIPGISIGHNGTAAFGLTIFPADQEDLCVYETAEGDPDSYRYGEGWERIHRIEETVAVRGEADQTVTLAFTRHGPVLLEDPAHRRAFALRTVWLEVGTAPYLASLSAMRATDLDAFRAALRGWGAPSVNQVYADTSGTVAWMPAGNLPRRRNFDGMLPVPGDGRYEWEGRIGPDELPCRVDPPEGYLATANEQNLPPDWDHAHAAVGFEWSETARITRIRDVLREDDRHSVAASCALQADVVSVPARRLARLAEALPEPGEAAAAIALLRGWDGRLDAGSAAAALAEIWWSKYLKPALFARAAGRPLLARLLPPGDSDSILAVLEQPPAWLGERRDALLRDTLAAAWHDAAKRLGPDPAAWQWGALHHGFFEHALHPVLPPGDAARFDIGPLPTGGSSQTPMHAGYRGDWRVTHGASVRLVMDVGAWDNSRCINAPGQSGDPRSPHYADLAEAWSRGEFVPLLFTREAVDAATARRIRLEPLA